MQLAATHAMPRRKGEPTIALINVVFLMLIFFLIAGTLAPPIDRDVTLVKVAEIAGREPPDALVAHADGTLTFRGNAVDAGAVPELVGETSSEGVRSLRIVPDRDLPARQLIELGDELRRAGADRVFIVTARGLE